MKYGKKFVKNYNGNLYLQFNKINADMNILKKNTEKYEKNKPTFKNIKTEINF